MVVWLEDEEIPATLEAIKFALWTVFDFEPENLDKSTMQTSFSYWENTGKFAVRYTRYLKCEQYLVCTNAVIRAFARYVRSQDAKWNKQMSELQAIMMQVVNQDTDDDDDSGLSGGLDDAHMEKGTSATVSIKQENDNANDNENYSWPARSEGLETPPYIDNSHLNNASEISMPELQNVDADVEDQQEQEDDDQQNDSLPPSRKRLKKNDGSGHNM